MPVLSEMLIPKSKSDDEFESLCTDVLEEKYGKRFSRYGRNGQAQDGIDIYYDNGNGFRTVAQCKNYFSQKSASKLIGQIKKDIEAANTAFKIDTFFVMTAMDRDTKVQNAVSQLKSGYSFTIELWFWDKIQEVVCSNKDLLKKYYPSLVTENIKKIITVDSAPFPTAHFIGRETELANIKKHIEENKNVMLVNGMGGIGKSEICKKLFHEYSETDGKIKYIGWVVFDENLKKTLYGKFEETLQITDFDENLMLTKCHIKNLSHKLLLFIDNMNEVSDEDKSVLHELGCNIIITSRIGEIDNIKTVHVGELSEDECVFIYTDILNRSRYDNETVRKIIRKAANLTLVVELLAKTAKATHLSDKSLLEKLEDKGFNLSDIKKKVNRDKQFNENLSMIFDLSRLSNEELLVLKQFSLFPPKPLDFKYADKWFAQDNPDILNNLANKGWLIETEQGFYMHHVISDVVRYENVLKHEECAELVDKIGDDLDFKETEIFTSRLGILPFGEKIAEYFKDIEDENTAFLMHNVARLYDRQGDYDKALEYYGYTLAISEKVLGKEHPSTANTYNNMALVFFEQGNYDKALVYYGYALTIKEKVLGKEHQSTATTYNNMAGVYYEQDNYGKALEYYGYALAIKEKVLGKEHSSTATTYNNIAGVYSEQGDYDKALEYYGYDFEINKKVLGKEHPSTATTYNNMAVVFKEQGDYDKALEYYGNALAICEKVLGKEHPSTATTYNNMAAIFKEQGDNDKALKYYGYALAIREKVLGKEHPSTANTYNNMAGVYSEQGGYDKGLDFYIKSYRIFLNKFGAEHPSTKTVFENMEEDYDSSGKTMGFEEWLDEQLNKE